MFEKIIDGVRVQWQARTGRVFWMSDWTRCDELARRGYLRTIHRGPSTFGHVDYYVDDDVN